MHKIDRNEEKGPISSPWKLFLTVLSVTTLLLILLGWSSWLSYREWQVTAAKTIRLQELIGIIKTTDEILTMSARMASVTGDLMWEERYSKSEPILDAAIKEAIQTLPDRALKASFAKTDKANTALVDMEKRSFDLVRGNSKDKAFELLFSEEYDNQKKVYSEGTLEALDYIDSFIKDALDSNRQRAFLSFLSSIAVLLLSLIAWLYVLRLTQSYLARQKKNEKELRESRGFLNSIIDNLPLVIFIKDAKTHRYLLYNKTVEDLMECPRQDLLKKNDYDLFPKELAELIIEKDREALRTGQLQEIPEIPIQTQHNGQRIMNTKKIPLPDSEGNPEFILGISEDITDRKKAEEEIKRLEEERIKSQRIESVGTLAGGIAHDFNNLLHGIYGYIALAKQEDKDREKCVEMLEEAEESMHLAINLTNQLLTFSKGGKPLREIIALPPVINYAVKLALSGSKVTSATGAEHNLWNVNADRDQISQVIQNIVLNGEQSMPDGGEITIEMRNLQLPGKDLPTDLPAGAYVEIALSDRGTGIPEEILDKIFDPYFTTKNMGSGLGLATSFSIIRNHDGAITVSTELGKGSTFRIYLPAFPDTATESDEPLSKGPGKQRAGRILVMDDEPIILQIAEKFITRMGHGIVTADKGEEAIEKYQKSLEEGNPYDLVILDLTIRGGLGGIETIRALQEMDPKVKAVVSSGYSDDAAIASCMEQGFKAVLKKPYSFENLHDVIQTVLC